MFFSFSKNKLQSGASMIEVLIVIAITGIALIGLLRVAEHSLRVSRLAREKAQASALAQETMEAVRNYRDGTDWYGTDPDGLGEVTTGVAYYLAQTSDIPPRWELVQGEESVDGFTRKVEFEKVSRDSNDNIESTYDSTGDDPDTRKITVTVSWLHRGEQKKVELITYLTNWQL